MRNIFASAMIRTADLASFDYAIPAPNVAEVKEILVFQSISEWRSVNS